MSQSHRNQFIPEWHWRGGERITTDWRLGRQTTQRSAKRITLVFVFTWSAAKCSCIYCLYCIQTLVHLPRNGKQNYIWPVEGQSSAANLQLLSPVFATGRAKCVFVAPRACTHTTLEAQHGKTEPFTVWSLSSVLPHFLRFPPTISFFSYLSNLQCRGWLWRRTTRPIVSRHWRLSAVWKI